MMGSECISDQRMLNINSCSLRNTKTVNDSVLHVKIRPVVVRSKFKAPTEAYASPGWFVLFSEEGLVCDPPQ